MTKIRILSHNFCINHQVLFVIFIHMTGCHMYTRWGYDVICLDK